jgi:D-alanyl-D-alanine carboxypeptidase
VEKHQINIHETSFIVTKKASKMIGTSANLKKKEIITIINLFYALMLPSGNDAA